MSLVHGFDPFKILKAALANGGKPVPDARIDRAFARRYKRYAGLAFWLFLTRDWVPES